MSKCLCENRKIMFEGSLGKAELTENNITLYMPGIKKKHTFVQISDLHITDYYDTDTEEEIAYAKERIEEWEGSSVRIYPEGEKDPIINNVAANRTVIERVNEIAPEAVFICGDVADLPTVPSYRKTYEVLSGLKPKYYITPGNHERIVPEITEGELKEYGKIFGEVKPVEVIELDEIKVIMLDSSNMSFTEEQLKTVEKEITENTILVTHMPFYTETIFNDMEDWWKKYFLAGMPEHDELTRRFAKMIREKKPTVLAGHTHEMRDYPDEEPLQLVTAPAYLGYYRLINIIPEKPDNI